VEKRAEERRWVWTNVMRIPLSPTLSPLDLAGRERARIEGHFADPSVGRSTQTGGISGLTEPP
jgi:hypothetical protein